MFIWKAFYLSLVEKKWINRKIIFKFAMNIHKFFLPEFQIG